MSDILARIYDAKSSVTAREQSQEPYETVRERALAGVAGRRPFLTALRSPEGPAIIGEIKRASPSAGLIARNFDPARIAAAYDAAGVDCISVLTESDHFLGELEYLGDARRNSKRPILRKDFLSTRYQIAQSAAYGADAVLLIVAGLTDTVLRACMDEAAQYGLDVLVEVHDRGELQRALACGATLVGINNRDLRTFETDLAVSEYLLPHVPSSVTVVSESGMQGPEDIIRLHGAGAKAFLIGEALMRADDAAQLIVSLKSAVVAMR
ncbi:MAG TPA: indole-3-glycerol phosphate synthase TrpC [Candidatus Baltobacteraceae bacterium]|jgi:indole-3-glycerol phosphate synthase|nr:indole-3-glycerol phosphate synthase TrpC [Candidatus Baltobacteraceae bacterium]